MKILKSFLLLGVLSFLFFAASCSTYHTLHPLSRVNREKTQLLNKEKLFYSHLAQGNWIVSYQGIRLVLIITITKTTHNFVLGYVFENMDARYRFQKIRANNKVLQRLARLNTFATSERVAGNWDLITKGLLKLSNSISNVLTPTNILLGWHFSNNSVPNYLTLHVENDSLTFRRYA